jgi:hypothetical protein
MILKKPENTGKWKSKCWMAISVEYGVEEAMDLWHRQRYDYSN